MEYSVVTHIVYITRWIVLAVPGTVLLKLTRKALPGEDNTTAAMIISQGILGALVFFIDRWIFS
jgi:hypothetical protein